VMDLVRCRGRAHAQHGVRIERQPACAGAHPASVGLLSGCRCPPSDPRGSDDRPPSLRRFPGQPLYAEGLSVPM
jgi:hypothetical protein